MTKSHFDLAINHDGRRYIYQKIKEHDKNHRENDMSPNSKGRMYEIPGKIKIHNMSKKLHKHKPKLIVITVITILSIS